MNIISKLSLIIFALFIVGCETTSNVSYQTRNTVSNGYGTIEFENGGFLKGNFPSENFCKDCSIRFGGGTYIYQGDVAVNSNNMWDLVNGSTYKVNAYLEGKNYQIELVRDEYSPTGMKQPIQVTLNNKVYKIQTGSGGFSEIPYLISITSPLGLTYEEALKECKTLGYKNASDALMDCVLELSQ